MDGIMLTRNRCLLYTFGFGFVLLLGVIDVKPLPGLTLWMQKGLYSVQKLALTSNGLPILNVAC